MESNRIAFSFGSSLMKYICSSVALTKPLYANLVYEFFMKMFASAAIPRHCVTGTVMQPPIFHPEQPRASSINIIKVVSTANHSQG